MSNSTGSSPTTSRSVPHSSQDTISPLSVSRSTWTSASHSGQVPVGTFSSSPAKVKAGLSPHSGEHLYLSKQPDQSTRERWNLQHSFIEILGPVRVTFLCRKYFSNYRSDKSYRTYYCGSPHLLAPYETDRNAGLT